VKSTFWPHNVSTYDLLKIVLEDPRVPKSAIAKKFRVNYKTAAAWWDSLIQKNIIHPPILKRKSFLNFREYYCFMNVEDPHDLYLNLQNKQGIVYHNVQTGFANFQIVSKTPLSLKGDTVLSGPRSDFYVSIPPDCSFEKSIDMIRKKIQSPDFDIEVTPSPLVYHDEEYPLWDDDDEKIYEELRSDLRKSFADVLKKTGTYKDKIMTWIRTRDDFGQTITMYFPEGLNTYQPTVFCVESEYDSVLIDLFSWLPASTVFYRVEDKLLISFYLPYNLEGRYIVREVLSTLRKKELVTNYTNSIVEYYFRSEP